jgi:hypothetical protein
MSNILNDCLKLWGIQSIHDMTPDMKAAYRMLMRDEKNSHHPVEWDYQEQHKRGE